MIWTIVRKEIASNITSPKVLITYIVCTVLIFAALLTGAYNYLSIKEEVGLQQSAERDRISNIFNFQQDYLQTGIYLYREPSVISVLVSGVEGDAARRANVTNYTPPGYDISRFNSTPILAVFGLLDLSFIVKMILSLFAILFTYDAVCGEREMGTLKLNLSNQVKRSSFIIGKLIGNFILLIIPFVLPLILGLLMLQFIPGIVFSGEDWIRILLIFLAFFLYLLAFYSMGMMVSSLTRSANVSFLVLLMLWVLFIAVVPRVAVLVAQNLAPVPTIDDVRKEVIKAYGPTNREAYAEIGKMQDRFIKEATAKRPRPPLVSTPQSKAEYDAMMVEYRQWAQKRQEEFTAEVVEVTNKVQDKVREIGRKLTEEQTRKQDRQNDLSVSFSRFTSPAAALTSITDRLARTGVFSSDEVFKDNIQSMHQSFVDDTNRILKEHPEYISYGMGQTEAINLSGSYPDVRNLPQETLQVSINTTMIDFMTLALAALLFLSIAFVAFLRYDVR